MGCCGSSEVDENDHKNKNNTQKSTNSKMGEKTPLIGEKKTEITTSNVEAKRDAPPMKKNTTPVKKGGKDGATKIEENIKIEAFNNKQPPKTKAEEEEFDRNFEEERLQKELKITVINLNAQTKREKIIEEILKTEQGYVQSLKIFKNRILIPFVDQWTNKIQKAAFDEMRRKVESVELVNSTLLSNLEQSALDNLLNDNIGEVFKIFIPFLKLYSVKTNFSFLSFFFFFETIFFFIFFFKLGIHCLL